MWQNGPKSLRTNTYELISKYCIEYLQEESLSANQSEKLNAETKPVKAKILAQKEKELPSYEGLQIKDILERKSHHSKIIRITCYCLKFLSKAIMGLKDKNERKQLKTNILANASKNNLMSSSLAVSLPTTYDVEQILTPEKHKLKYFLMKSSH